MDGLGRGSDASRGPRWISGVMPMGARGNRRRKIGKEGGNRQKGKAARGGGEGSGRRGDHVKGRTTGRGCWGGWGTR